MVHRLFSWSADSFIVHSLDSPLLTSSSTARMHLLDLLLSSSFVDHLHCRPYFWLPASAGLSLSLTSSSTASARWTYFVVGFIVDGQHLLDLLRQHCRRQTASVTFLDFLSSNLLTASVSWAYLCRHRCRRPASAGLVFIVNILVNRWPA